MDKKKQQLEDRCFDLERQTNCQDELNETNVEEATLKYADKVAKSEILVKKAFEEKSVKCFSIDTKICKNISAFSNTLTQFVRTENKIFNPKLFAEKLITFYNPGARVETGNDELSDELINHGFELEDFYQVGKQLTNLINEIPVFHYTCGSFKPNEIDTKALIKPRKERQKRVDFTNGQTTRPKDYDEAKDGDDDVVTEEIEHLLKEIEKKIENSKDGKVDFYEAIVDKDCLTSSVTRIFHSAFMIKEGMLYIEEKNGFNYVRPVTDDETSNVTELPRRQQVLRFNKATFDSWRTQRGDY